MPTVALVFIDIAVIMTAARLFGRLAIKVGQPPVVGEIVAGIALGPSLLGLLPGNLQTRLLTPEILPYLNILAQLGLALFMFIVGLELDMRLIRGREPMAGTISAASVALPFALGAALSLVLYRMHDETASGPVSPVALALFLGVAMSITAFPVLARILTDRGMHRSPIGVIALACAAVDDIIAWTMLALVVAVVQGNGTWDILRIVISTVVFAAVMFGVVKPLLRRLNDRYRRVGWLTPDILSIVLIGVLVSSFATETIGIHAIFGAFLFGAAMPRRGAADMTREILERLDQVSVLLLLPLFFVITGLSTSIGSITGAGLWQLGLILVVATGGKFAGAYLGARAMKVRPRQATALGLLLNTRGLTELVILNVGKQVGVLDSELFTMMVLMALITTAMTGPLLKRVYPDRAMRRDIVAATRPCQGESHPYRVLTLLDEPTQARELARVGAALLGTGDRTQLVLTRLVTRATAALDAQTPVTADPAGVGGVTVGHPEMTDQLQGHGVRCSVLTRFTTDAWSELVTHAAGVEADVVLVSAGFVEAVRRERGDDPPADTPFTLTIADLGSDPIAAGTAVGVLVDQGADGRAAMALGSAAAAHLSGPLHVAVPDGSRVARRMSAALRPLRGDGLDVRLVDAVEQASGASLVLTAGGGAYAGDVVDPPGRATVVRVHAGLHDLNRELAEQLARPAAPRRSAA